MTTQLGNSAGGDIAGGDIHKTEKHYHYAPTPMSALVEQYKAEAESDKTLCKVIEDLQHFFSNATASDIRSLEEKLLASGRQDMLQDALKRKQDAHKRIMRDQGSKSAQMIYGHILAELIVNFDLAVRPLIQDNADRSTIDKAILDDVITPAVSGLEANPLGLNKLDILGLLYFLGGNCHVRWDPC